jgi:hypothetical protein
MRVRRGHVDLTLALALGDVELVRAFGLAGIPSARDLEELGHMTWRPAGWRCASAGWRRLRITSRARWADPGRRQAPRPSRHLIAASKTCLRYQS